MPLSTYLVMRLLLYLVTVYLRKVVCMMLWKRRLLVKGFELILHMLEVRIKNGVTVDALRQLHQA